MLSVNSWINLPFYLRFQNVKNWKIHGNSSKRTCPTRVAVYHRLRIHLCTVCVGGTKNDNQIVFPIMFDNLLNVLLTIQVKGASSSSDKALGLNEHGFSPGTLHAGFNRWTLNSISFANDDDFLPF